MIGDKVCKCCGQTLPPAVDADIVLSRGERLIFEAVRKAGKHGIHTDRLFDLVYGDDIDGGPGTGIKALHARVCLLNKRLAAHGLRVAGTHTGSRFCYGRYTIHQTELANAAE